MTSAPKVVTNNETTERRHPMAALVFIHSPAIVSCMIYLYVRSSKNSHIINRVCQTAWKEREKACMLLNTVSEPDLTELAFFTDDASTAVQDALWHGLKSLSAKADAVSFLWPGSLRMKWRPPRSFNTNILASKRV